VKRILAAQSLVVALALAAIISTVPVSFAQRDVRLMEPGEARIELSRALEEGREAERRAKRFAAEAEEASETADKAAREAAALAAEIQASEAGIAAARARYSLARMAREDLRARLAQRQQPLVRLTGALQTTARRPLALSVLQPGSLEDLVHVRAVLSSAVPEIRERTAALRSELQEGERLERRAARALVRLRQSEERLRTRRAALQALEMRQRLASREARAFASREETRALTLAEEARDLDGLVERLGEAARLRRDLAALSGPILRPRNIAEVIGDTAAADDAPITDTAPPSGFRLPVQGRIVSGFGERQESGLRASGLSLAPVSGAQVVAPAAGRVVFAGPYRGFGRIVIIEHRGQWTSLVTGLARTGVAVGDDIIAGAPIGVAGRGRNAISVELRRDGEPVNPLAFIG